MTHAMLSVDRVIKAAERCYRHWREKHGEDLYESESNEYWVEFIGGLAEAAKRDGQTHIAVSLHDFARLNPYSI